jgi:hypothetical protein
VKWSLRTILQAREKTNKRFHGAIPKLLHSIKHSRSKADPLDDELHHVRKKQNPKNSFSFLYLENLFDC